jgi:hypothetical protein
MSWMHGKSGHASLSSRLDNADFTESTLSTDGFMWIRYSQFQGSWLDLEAINSRLDGSLQVSDKRDTCDTSVLYTNTNHVMCVQYAL